MQQQFMFDTYAYVDELTQAGVPLGQAEVMMRTQKKLFDEVMQFDSRAQASLNRIEKDMALVKWGLGVTSAGVVAILGLIGKVALGQG